MINKDKFLDKALYSKDTDNRQQILKAQEFFDSLPDSDFESPKLECPSCHCRHTTYCLKCGQLLIPKAIVPQLHLPVDLLILHHEKEKHQKSSALPAQFISDNVQIVNYPAEVAFNESTYVLYPHKDARFVKDISNEELNSIKTIVAIDCTWYQTNKILEDIDRANPNIKYIKLQDYETYFWRYQHHSLKCLATIEAIYYFYKEYSQQLDLPTSFTPLLFFYKYTFQLIKKGLKLENKTDNVYEKIEKKKSKRLEQKQKLKLDKKFDKQQQQQQYQT